MKRIGVQNGVSGSPVCVHTGSVLDTAIRRGVFKGRDVVLAVVPQVVLALVCGLVVINPVLSLSTSVALSD